MKPKFHFILTIKVFFSVIIIFLLLSACETISKSGETENEFRAITQSSVPDNYKEIPFEETAPPPSLSAEERQRGFMIFSRPAMEPVYPNTHPLATEKITELSAFASLGEFEPLIFSIYPVRDLKNLKVTITDLKSAKGDVLNKAAIDIRLVTYWNMGYPFYTSRSTYRRVPELLEKVTVHSSLAHECQRWWLTVHVPEKSVPGIYSGEITVSDDFGNPVKIPIRFRVLGYKLHSDSQKHYSAYFNMKNKIQYSGKNNKEARRMLDNEYKAMKDLGMNMIPTMNLEWDTINNKISLRHSEEMERMMHFGLRGPVPVTAGGVIRDFYKKYTPEGEVHSHWKVTKMPPPGFYKYIEDKFREFVKESKAKNWPEFYCCPIDEVAAESREFGVKVFKMVKDAGMKTYITKNPVAPDASDYQEQITAWCSQPFSVAYSEIENQNKWEYWSYPNHNAGEIKDRLTMCKGGRMTYGYGFWRSGYKTLIPWHWAWVMESNQFDYLRSKRSGCGQRIDDNGEVIPSVYWENFREGIDDNRYIYTLQQAIWERENTDNKELLKLVREAKSVLQKLWDDIHVQEKYLNTGMWASEEFNARRWQLAQYIIKLQAFPASRKGVSPSVLVDTHSTKKTTNESVIDREIKRGNVVIEDLSKSFENWNNQTPEGKITLKETNEKNEAQSLLWNVKVDYSKGEKGYPIGWPIINCFYHPGLDFTRYNYLKYRIKTNSNRDENADDKTLLGFTMRSDKMYEKTKDIGGVQNVWIPIVFDLQEMIKETARGDKPWKKVDMLQLYIAEKDYKDKTKISFEIGTLQLIRIKNPVISEIQNASTLLLPLKSMPVNYNILGEVDKDKTFKIVAELQTESGEIVSRKESLVNHDKSIILDTDKIKPGNYNLIFKLYVDGLECSSLSKKVNFVKGPFY
jgi:hypothetical protein